MRRQKLAEGVHQILMPWLLNAKGCSGQKNGVIIVCSSDLLDASGDLNQRSGGPFSTFYCFLWAEIESPE